MTTCCTRGRSPDLARDERGIAMTEAAIALPFFLLVWIGIVSFHAIYLSRLKAQVDAHGAAFDGALVGKCHGIRDDRGDRGGERMRDEIDGQTGNDRTGSLSGQADESLGAGEGGDSLFDWSHYTTEARVPVGRLPGGSGGPGKIAVGRARVLCNMEPAGGLGDAFYDMVQGWFE